MSISFPSPTVTWHNDTYAAISPRNPFLSQKDKTIIITGGGSGIGRATAIAFAQAGAKHISLIGRTKATLEETAALIHDASPITSTATFAASVTDEDAIKEIAQKVGFWDVLILNAAHLTPPDTILNIPLRDFWTSHEVNVKSVYIAAQTFIPTANPHASFLAVNAAGCVLPAAIGAGLTGYMTSKIAQAKFIEYLAHEHPELFVSSVHPGVVATKMVRDADLEGSRLPQDTVELPAHFMVWLAGSQEKRFLHGRMVWVNWDVEELAAKAEEIVKEEWFTMGMLGWPFSQSGKLGHIGSVR